MSNLKIQNPTRVMTYEFEVDTDGAILYHFGCGTALYTMLDNLRVSSVLDFMSNLPTIISPNMWQRKSFHGSQVQASTRVGLRRGASNFKAYGFVT